MNIKDKLLNMSDVDIYKLVLEGNLKRFPNGFFTDKYNGKLRALNCVKYLLEDILNFTIEDIKTKTLGTILNKYKLRRTYSDAFNSVNEIIITLYPNIKEWELKTVRPNYWNYETGKDATRWLIEEKLLLSKDNIKNKLSCELFIKNGLSGMLQTCFNNSPFLAINSIYPNEFREWELPNVPREYWNNKQNRINATKWLIEDVLKFSIDDIKSKLSSTHYKINGLERLIDGRIYEGRLLDALNEAYPNTFSKSDLKTYGRGRIICLNNNIIFEDVISAAKYANVTREAILYQINNDINVNYLKNENKLVFKLI